MRAGWVVLALVAFANEARAEEPVDSIELTFTGDVMFGRWTPNGRATIPAGSYNLFSEIEAAIRADVAVGNLETPVLRTVPARSPYGTRLRFAATPAETEHLVRGGFTHVTLANNHSYDMRLRGALETPVVLRELGIVPVGLSHKDAPTFRADTIETKGWRIAVIGITTERNGPQRKKAPVLPFVERARDIPAALAPVVRQARTNHDLVVVIAHWGEEYDDKPRRAQRKAARALVDAGADLIIGHHPHVLQGVERYRHGVIAYSLGNFRFDYARGLSKMTGVLRARFTRGSRCAEEIRFHPAVIRFSRVARGKKTFRPISAAGRAAERVHARVRATSRELGVSWRRAGDDLVMDSVCSPAN